MSREPNPQRHPAAEDRLWRQIELIHQHCGPESPEWRKVIALIASRQLAERELAYQIVKCGVHFTSPN